MTQEEAAPRAASVDYEATLKPASVETPLYLAFFRPAAHRVVEWALPRGITANQLTLASIATGLAGAAMLSSKSARVRALGGLFGLAYGVLDCADGQLARATKTSSRIGRILDGASDYIVGTATGAALASTFARKHGRAGVLLALGGLASIVVQGTLFDHAKNRYLSLTQSSYREGDDLAETLADITRLEAENGSVVELALLRVYALFLRIQSALSRSSEAPPAKLDPLEAKRLADELAPIARGWAWLGPSTHVALLATFGGFDRVEAYVFLRLVGGNAAAFWLSKSFAARQGS
ncbi:MAG: CDP-alcohol phosphatidyltransferase family protein [Polyangiaceae bacterium]